MHLLMFYQQKDKIYQVSVCASVKLKCSYSIERELWMKAYINTSSAAPALKLTPSWVFGAIKRTFYVALSPIKTSHGNI